ncbi:MAG: hypothetical protein ACXWO1_00065, partial [Isosphaeraceae bacterium]
DLAFDPVGWLFTVGLSHQPGVHPAEASSSNRDRTGIGPAYKRRLFISTFGSFLSSTATEAAWLPERRNW